MNPNHRPISTEEAYAQRHRQKARREAKRRTEAERQRERRARLAARSPEQIIRDRIAKHPDGTKACSGCHRELAFHQFPEFSRERDGLHRYCFSCNATKETNHV